MNNSISKRIGKDLRITWPVRINGSSDISGADLTLEMSGPYSDVKTIQFNRETGKIWFIFRGKDQKSVGNYSFTLWLNKDQDGQTVVDQPMALTLVRHTCQEDNGDTNNVSVDSMELNASNLEIAVKGDKGDKGDPLRYSDLTQQQKQDLVSHITAQNVTDALGYTPLDGNSLRYATEAEIDALFD